jgi:arginyl-tRNA synthetase
MIFHPDESIDLQGHTGPFIQYAHARASAVLRKAVAMGFAPLDDEVPLLPQSIKQAEIDLMRQLALYVDSIESAYSQKNPALLCQYAFDLAGHYNRFYHDCPMLTPETPQDSRLFRLYLSKEVGRVLKRSLWVLGIEAPERM